MQPTHQHHIVLVEDSDSDVFLVKEAFARHNLVFQLTVLDDGEKAIDFVRSLDGDDAQDCPHLYLVDLNLPKLSGDLVLEQIRKSRRCSDTPVMIITSSASPRDKAETNRLGATSFFQKPSRLDEFLKLGSVVAELLSNRNKSHHDSKDVET